MKKQNKMKVQYLLFLKNVYKLHREEQRQISRWLHLHWHCVDTGCHSSSTQDLIMDYGFFSPTYSVLFLHPGAMYLPGKRHTRTRPSMWCKRVTSINFFFNLTNIARLLDWTTQASFHSLCASVSLGRPWPCRRFTTVPFHQDHHHISVLWLCNSH